MEELPSVSVRVLTYKRKHWLEETIHYFLNQTYKGKKELVILNDDPYVKYVYKHPEVKIHNWDCRFEFLTQKENLATMFCRGELLFRWPDDDIWKPWAIETVVRYLGNRPFTTYCPFWKEKIPQEKQPQIIKRPTATNYIVRKELWDKLGDIPTGTSRNYWIPTHAKKLGVYYESFLKPEEMFFTWRTWSKKYYKGFDNIITTEETPSIEICYLEPGIKTGLLK